MGNKNRHTRGTNQNSQSSRSHAIFTIYCNTKHKKDSPHTSHTKGVLHTINYGSSREIGKLQSVGPKTAQHISLFRDIKGKLSKLSDLKQIPGWGTKKFDRFVEQNLLKEELL
uniref:Kinesin-like protein KIF3A n=1 Tax=Diabrotica virgifera virgifera TaxID=50390 RepID=A0A6P7GHI0_DIAVI